MTWARTVARSLSTARLGLLACSILLVPSGALAQGSRGAGASHSPSPYFGSASSSGTVAAAGGLTLASGLSLFLGSSTPASPEPGVLDVTARTARWRGGILMDERVRGALLFEDDGARERAALVSDAILGALVLNSLAVDSLAIPLANGDSDMALEASSAYTVALGTTLILGEIVKNAVSRARPFERYCLDDPDRDGCGNDDTLSSFYSLHSAVAFTSAGFSCAMHVGRELYGDPVADIAACGTSVAAATTVALLRVASDRHYLTDVLVGSAIGLAVGIVVPLVLVSPRRPPADPDALPTPSDGPSAVVMPLFAPSPTGGGLGASTIGLTFSGTF